MNSQNEDIVTRTDSVAKDFSGTCGYIITNMVDDYSMFGTVYEYGDGVKLPIPPIEGAEIVVNEYEKTNSLP